MTGEELKAVINSFRIKANAARFIALACFYAAIVAFLCDKVQIGIALSFGLSILFATLEYKCQKKIKKILIDNIIGVVLKEVLGDSVEYDPNGKVTPGHMALPFIYNKIQGEDHIRAVYKGLNIELSNLTLIDEEEGIDSEGDTVWNRFTVFDGQWLICDFGKELSGDVFVSAYPEKGNNSGKSDFRMDNEDFNNRFFVKADVPEEAYYILTPHMMENILTMADRIEGRVFMSFLRDGKMHIAVNRKHSLFELGDSKVEYETLRQKFIDELKWFTDMIDTLRVEDTICQKEVNV